MIHKQDSQSGEISIVFRFWRALKRQELSLKLAGDNVDIETRPNNIPRPKNETIQELRKSIVSQTLVAEAEAQHSHFKMSDSAELLEVKTQKGDPFHKEGALNEMDMEKEQEQHRHKEDEQEEILNNWLAFLQKNNYNLEALEKQALKEKKLVFFEEKRQYLQGILRQWNKERYFVLYSLPDCLNAIRSGVKTVKAILHEAQSDTDFFNFLMAHLQELDEAAA